MSVVQNGCLPSKDRQTSIYIYEYMYIYECILHKRSVTRESGGQESYGKSSSSSIDKSGTAASCGATVMLLCDKGVHSSRIID